MQKGCLCHPILPKEERLPGGELRPRDRGAPTVLRALQGLADEKRPVRLHPRTEVRAVAVHCFIFSELRPVLMASVLDLAFGHVWA